MVIECRERVDERTRTLTLLAPSYGVPAQQRSRTMPMTFASMRNARADSHTALGAPQRSGAQSAILKVLRK
jgi:hypothetical protein